MYAVINDRGKQYKVSKDEEVLVDSLDIAEGGEWQIDDVLLLQTETELLIGTPRVANANVSCEVLSHCKGDKIEVVKFRRRKGYHKRQGHRQKYSKIKITAINY